MSSIKLVISDCDGTLVTPDKQLTKATLRAVARLRDAGIGFTLTSSRPPFGMRMLTSPLGIALPLGAFNGSAIVAPDLSPLATTFIPRKAAEAAVTFLARCAVDIWIFTADAWIVVNQAGAYVAHEQKTIDAAPHIVEDFTPFFDTACKIVGASADAELLARCEIELRSMLGSKAHAARSQSYYLDVTPPGRDKGSFVDYMASRLQLTNVEIATLGDMQNDVAMFKRSALSFAMGNAPEDVKAQASHVTAANTEDGFAKAIDVILKT